MTSKIIELKEIYDTEPKADGDSGIGKKNGEFTNSFTEKIRMDKGDALKIKSVFINDSTGPDGNIMVEEDIPVTISVGYYVRDWGSYNYTSDYLNAKNFEPVAQQEPRTNKHFVLCRPTTHAGTELLVESIRIEWRKSMVFGADWMGQNAKLAFSYQADDGSIKQFHFTITKRKVQDLLQFDSLRNKHFIELNSNTNSKLKKGKIPFPLRTLANPDFTDISGENNLGNGPLYDFSSTPTQAGAVSFNTFTQDVTFTLKKKEGGYAPAELAQFLTENITKLTDNSSHSTPQTDESALITTTLLEEARNGGANDQIYLEEDAERLYTSNVAGNQARNTWVGTNQFAILYRDDLGGKFEIQGTHLPLYSGGQEGVCLLSNGVNNYIANKHSGIFISKVEPSDFFTKFLKIDESSLISVETGSVTKQIGARPATNIYPTYNFQEGVNVTGQLVSLDTIINKENFAFEKPAAHITMAATDANGDLFLTKADGTNRGVSTSFIAEQQHFTILGSIQVAEVLDDAYYQVEIEMPIRVDFNSSVIQNKRIHGIVGRYYNTNSYTQAVEGEGAFTYIHNSDTPLYLSEFKVRILDSKGRLAENIKNDNTILLELLKQDSNQI